MELENPKHGEIHKRLIRNECPNCRKPLEVIEKTVEDLVRWCESCNLTIADQTSGAEFPEDVCD